MDYYLGVWKKYAVFSGRARRKEYWMFVLFSIIAYVILAIIDAVLRTSILVLLYDLAVIVPSLAVGARRLHDVGLSAWLLLIGLVPFLGAIALLIIACIDSQPGDNKYGPNPKGVSGQPNPTV